MKWAKNLKKIFSFKKSGPALLAPLLLLALIIALLAVFFKFIFNGFGAAGSPAAALKPAVSLEINEPFSGQLYFNNEMGGSVFSDAIIPAIGQAKKTLELAVYSMDDTRIRGAIYQAADRGVAVTLIFSDKRQTEHDKIFKDMPAGIKRLDISSDAGSMHHKFLLIDRGAPGAKLFFGSYNFTYLQEKFDPCFLLETGRPEIIKIFGEEFDRLLQGYHGIGKLAFNPNPFAARIKYSDGFLEIWFCPQVTGSGLKERMLDLIKNAGSSIKVMIWDFTSNDLAAALANAAGKTAVRIITDDTNYSSPVSAFNYLLAEKIKRHLDNLEIITDANRNQEIKDNFKETDLNSFLHHHLLLIDDKIAIFGTNNWSGNGFYYNDESVMITDIGALVKGFGDTWDFNYRLDK